MDKRKVPVILMPDEPKGYAVLVPLFPGCTTGGDTPQEALRNAREAMELLLEDANEDDLENLDLIAVDYVAFGNIEVRVPAKVRRS